MCFWLGQSLHQHINALFYSYLPASQSLAMVEDRGRGANMQMQSRNQHPKNKEKRNQLELIAYCPIVISMDSSRFKCGTTHSTPTALFRTAKGDSNNINSVQSKEKNKRTSITIIV